MERHVSFCFFVGVEIAGKGSNFLMHVTFTRVVVEVRTKQTMDDERNR